MTDLLQSVGRGWRIFCAVVCAIGAILFLLVAVVLSADMLRRGTFEQDGKPLWVGVVIVGILGLVTAYLSWRLARGRPSANGVTLLPTWFISAFGLLLLVGVVCASYGMRRPIFAFEGVFVAG